MHNSKRLYQNFLILEFTALAVLIGSLFWLGQLTESGQALNLVHRLLPTLSSGLVLTGFLGAMYVRWVDAAESPNRPRRLPFILFWLLGMTLFLIWLVAASQWLLHGIPESPSEPTTSSAQGMD